MVYSCFFFQAEDGIRDYKVTGVQTCALPISTRRDDMLGAAADAAQGTLVAADLPDQAGAVRDLVASYRRARASETRTEESRPRAWLPLMLGVVLLVVQAASRRTAALVGLAFACLALPSVHAAQQPQFPRSPAEKAWDRQDRRRARAAYLGELAARRKEDAEIGRAHV